MDRISIITGLISMLCWGIGDFLISIVVRKFKTYKTMFLNNLNFVLILVPFLFFINLNISFSNLILIIISGFIFLIASYNFYEAFRIGNLSIVAPITSSYPLLTVIFLTIIFKIELSFFSVISIFLLIIGVMLISIDIKNIKKMNFKKGISNALLTMFFWGIYFFLLEIISNNKTFLGINFPEMSLFSLFVYINYSISIPQLIYSLSKNGIPKINFKKEKKQLIITLIASMIAIVAWFSLNFGYIYANSALVTPISSLYPAITIFLAMIFYKEKLVFNQKIGIIIILIGLIMINL
jgi:drug/metabolite transporter (DMT)-like permease